MNTAVNVDRLNTEVSKPSIVSGTSWGAVFAGATGAASLSLVLLVLGVGLGFSSVSPWSRTGITATTFGVSAIAWLTFTQLAASGVGGYLAGRLRVKWVAVHTDEVFFRDTAHGFLAWSIASLAMATLLATSVTSIVGGGVHAAGAVAGGAAAAGTAMAPHISDRGGDKASPSDALNYSIDSLFRVDPKTAPAGPPVDSAVISRVFVQDLAAGQMSESDKTYVAQVVAQRTGSSQADAEQRVGTLFNDLLKAKNDAIQAAKEAADAARKATAVVSLWMAFSLFVGAFCARDRKSVV